jgi:hypothetical protein
MLIKWKLMLTTLPYVLVAVLAKAGLNYGAHFDGLIEFSEVGLVLTGGVFLIGFMLAGTMADYKESEKIPGELACTLETLEETLVQASIAKPTLDTRALKADLYEISTSIWEWLFKKLAQERLFLKLTTFSERVHELERVGAGGYASRMLSELHNLRKTVTRIAVISRTGFLSTGYALLETLTVVIVGLLMIARFKNPIAEIILVAFVTLIYTYMLRLIRDVDDPFEYEASGAKGAAEVDLFPLSEYLERAKKRL